MYIPNNNNNLCKHVRSKDGNLAFKLWAHENELFLPTDRVKLNVDVSKILVN